MLYTSKIIDESKQGEAMQLLSSDTNTRKLYLESYGCQMNFSDSEIVASIMQQSGFDTTQQVEEADVILINTCSIRDNAEQRVRKRLTEFKKLKLINRELIVGVLGCMAERLKTKFLEEEKLLDLVAGPDAYRDLPQLIEQVDGGNKAINVLLSKEETYADITPVRYDSNGISAYISIMRGCDNMCSFCVVPFTRGRERSRDPETIIQEAVTLYEKGYREITLLGQNVDSYIYSGGGLKKEILTFEQRQQATSFSQLLDRLATRLPDMRIRFSTSNPRDMLDEVLYVIAKHENICKYIHLPVQSGSSEMLQRMNRGYSREEYLNRIQAIRTIVPDCAISTDIIVGFCDESDDEHQETLSMMELVKYEFAFMFKYSERPKTLAERQYQDNVSDELKTKRLNEIIQLQQQHSAYRTANGVGKVHKVLVEGVSKKSDQDLMGRNSQNTVVVFPKENFHPGQYVDVLAEQCTTATLIGKVVKVY